jgi:hypothetical protein
MDLTLFASARTSIEMYTLPELYQYHVLLNFPNFIIGAQLSEV